MIVKHRVFLLRIFLDQVQRFKMSLLMISLSKIVSTKVCFQVLILHSDLILNLIFYHNQEKIFMTALWLKISLQLD